MRSKASKRLSSIKKRARLKNIEFNLDYNWMCSKLKQKNCEVSNLLFDHDKGVWYTQSIDRVNNNHGYTKDNCKIVLFGMNVGKGTSSYEDLYKISKAFIKQFEGSNK